jgi:leucine dehydrogenase
VIRRLCDAGAEVLFSDVNPAAVRRFHQEHGLPLVAPEDVYSTRCDILSPCALGGILNADTIPRLRCRAIVGAANNQLASPELADALRGRGILYAPDFVVNLGGAVAITGMEALGWTRDEASARVIGAIEDALRETFDLADAQGVSTDSAARQLVQERLARCMHR